MKKYIPEILATAISITILLLFVVVFGKAEIREHHLGVVMFCSTPIMMVVFFRKDYGRDSDE